MKGLLKKYEDIAKLPEAEQIRRIGEKALLGNTVGFLVKANGQGERYTREINRLFPDLEVSLIGPLTSDTTAYRAQLKRGKN